MNNIKGNDSRKLNNIITATELKNNLGMYLDYVINNNEVVITKNGKKVVRLIPYVTDTDRYFLMKEKALDYQYGGKKVSYEEFMEIYEESDLRLEFINGEIVLLSSPSAIHQEVAGNLFVEFRERLKKEYCKVFFAPFDVHCRKKDFKDPDVMQPDLSIICDTEAINENGQYVGTPELVVEILSPSTRSKDMVDKLNTFMISGVREYWIVDPDKEIILVYGFKDLDIDHFMTYRKEDTVQSYRFSDLKVAGTVIFL